MTDEPLITIVIPVRDRASIVGRTLESVAAQTLRPLRVVMVDNGSGDATAEVLDDWCGRFARAGVDAVAVSEARAGAARARNRGLEEVTTRYVMFFDSDDIMAPDHCRSVADGIVAAGYPDIAGWAVRQQLLDGRSSTERFCRRDLMVNHLFHGCLSTVRFAVATDLLRSIGGWDGSLRGWDDYELGIRLLMATESVARLPLAADTVLIMAQEESITGTSYSRDPAKWEGALDACSQALAAGGRHDMLRWIDVRRVILAGEYRREGRHDLSRRLMERTLDSAPTLWRRMAYRLLHSYFVRVGRGVSQLARVLI